MESPSPLVQADLSPKHGDEQNDGEAAEHPEVLKQEEHQLGGGVGLFLGYAVHLWELREVGGKHQISLMWKRGNTLTLLFYISHNGKNYTKRKCKWAHLIHYIFVPLGNSAKCL